MNKKNLKHSTKSYDVIEHQSFDDSSKLRVFLSNFNSIKQIHESHKSGLNKNLVLQVFRFRTIESDVQEGRLLDHGEGFLPTDGIFTKSKPEHSLNLIRNVNYKDNLSK